MIPAAPDLVVAFRTHVWSNGETPEPDAAGGNNGYINGDFGFHTGFERDPWWQVDLLFGFAI
jgi:hypothetical protein